MNILMYPNECLLKKTSGWPITDHTMDGIQEYAEKMQLLLNSSSGVALAANQVGIPYYFFVIKNEYAEKNNLPKIVINPIVTEISFITEQIKEGCLSFPNHFLSIERPKTIKVLFYSGDGSIHCQEFSGFSARIFLHEIEHLEGKTYLQNVSSAARNNVLKSFNMPVTF